MSVIITSSIENFESRLFLTNGLLCSGDNDGYVSNAIIPKYPLRNEKIKTNSNEFEPHNSIFCFKINDGRFQGIVDNLGIQDLESIDDFMVLVNEKKIAYDLMKGVFRNILGMYVATDDFTVHDIYIGNKSQITSTIDFNSNEKKKIGFHFDNWDGLPVSSLRESQNRICVNLGKAHRYFLFIDKTVFDMRNELSLLDKNFEEIEDSNEIGQLYIRKIHPSAYKVFAIKLMPFEAYIAPTETIMHDGANFDSECIDIQLTARGLFKP